MKEEYPNTISQNENGYIIGGENKLIKFANYFKIIFLILIITIGMNSIDFRNFEFNLDNLKLLIPIAIFYLLLIQILFRDRKVYINNDKIIFIDGIKPFKQEFIVEKNDIKEISINYEFNDDNKDRKYYGNDRFYNIDLIDKKLNAYRFFQSRQYNDELLKFANSLSKIMKINLNDRSDKEGFGTIYRERKI
jgi:hypothetical protein